MVPKVSAQGDRNTKYFHSRTLARKRSNQIEGLKINSNEWCFEDEPLKRHVVDFFLKLFSLDSPIIGQLPCRGCFLRLSLVDIRALKWDVSDIEIRNALFGMAPLKASRVDRYHTKFFQMHWDVVGPSICYTIRRVLEGQVMDPYLICALLVLISEVIGPERITQFRIISLCTVLYKIITKTMINRVRPLMGKLTNPNQDSFVIRRNIGDNIVVAQDIIHSLRNFKGNRFGMALKIDLRILKVIALGWLRR